MGVLQSMMVCTYYRMGSGSSYSLEERHKAQGLAQVFKPQQVHDKDRCEGEEDRRKQAVGGAEHGQRQVVLVQGCEHTRQGG